MAFKFRNIWNIQALPLRQKIWFEIICCICRYIFAITFIVSGFTKVMNPKALENVVEHYFVAYGLSMPDWFIDSFAIGMSAAELTLGVMLLFKIFVRIMSIASVVFISIFTVVTLLNATVFKMEDCGCFGALIDLTPWQSFTKNIILLPMSIAIWYNYRREMVFETWLRDVIVTCVTIAASLGLTLWTYMGLPFEFFDKTPFPIGTDLHNYVSNVNDTATIYSTDVIVYRNNQTGELREFAVDDKAWHALAADKDNWSYYDTKVEENKSVATAKLDFWIGAGADDKTVEIINAPKAYLLFMTDDDYDSGVRDRFEAAEKYAIANGGVVIYVTRESLGKVKKKQSPCYNMDARVMTLMLRADYGLVVLEEGVIKEKYNYRQIPY